jgi:hypothetical protein
VDTTRQNAKVISILKSKNGQSVIRQDANVQELKETMLCRFWRSDVSIQSLKRFAKRLAGFPEDPPVFSV